MKGAFMKNATKNTAKNTTTLDTGEKTAECAICGKVYLGDRRNQALGIHRAKSHNQKNVKSAQDLLSKFKERRKEAENIVDNLGNLIDAIEYEMKNGK